MNELRQELKQDIGKLEQRIDELRQELKQDMNELRQELKQDIGKLEQRIDELRQELEQRISELRREAKQDRQDIARDLKILGERTARVQGTVMGLWDDGMIGETEAVSRPVASHRQESE